MSMSLFASPIEKQIEDFLIRYGDRFMSKEEYKTMYGKKLFGCELFLPGNPVLGM